MASVAVSKGIEGVVRKDPKNSGPFKRCKPKEISATANGNTNNRKIDEEDHFSLQVDFVLIIPRSPFYITHTHLPMVHMGLVKLLNFRQ